MLNPVSNKVDFPKLEEDILKFWEEHNTFQASVNGRPADREYVFYDGPPFATGLPHYGHLLAGTIKDIVPRYWTMRGHRVVRRFGWDCHGLPIEALAQEKLGLAGAGAIVEHGIGNFNETCRSMVLRYVGEWRRTVTRMGRWVDFDHDYKTMDASFMETIWWVFQQLWEQKRVYKSYRIMPYSWKLTTPLSNFEAGSNYQQVQDPAITVRLRLRTASAEVLAAGEAHALIWTTTPWTLPENLAICVGPDIDYVAVRDTADACVYVLAESRLAAYYPKAGSYEVVTRFKGTAMEGWTYEPMFPYFADEPGAFRALVDGFVTTEDGTGIVHIAPAYGEDDFRVGRAAGIGLVDPLDAECRFTARVPDFAGQFCKDADKAIIRRLKEEKKLVHQTTLVHSYPFCDRTDTPLIYRAIDAWYVRVEDLRDRLAAANEAVHWVPDYVGSKRFGNWLKEAKDWNISRNRFWGSCIPVWVNEADPDDMICVGSIAELEALSGVRVTDLHKHVVDEVVIRRDGKTYRRTPEVLDCWFESGSMPYAQHHYPFERTEHLEQFFPAEFIAEGLDQTRGWFYTLLVLGTALFGKSPYRNVVVNGLVLAEDGRKMSKRLKNYPDPNHILDTYGADALRLYMINSPVVHAEDLRFSEEGVKQSLRDLIIPLWNAYAFFVTYARVDGWKPVPGAPPAASAHPLDRWILSCLDRLTQEVVAAMDGYDLQQSVRPFVKFIEDLTNWYIRRSRRRFWKSGNDADKACAYATLYETLLRLSKIAAPFVPFVSEAIYRNLRSEDMPGSVHLCDFPTCDGARRDLVLEREMEDVVTVVQIGRQIRRQYDLKVRQPLAAIHVVCRDAAVIGRLRDMQDMITDELNVKTVKFDHDESRLAVLKAKPNFRVLGPMLGAAIKQAGALLARMSEADLETILAGGTVNLQVGDRTVVLGANEIQVERQPRPGMAVGSEGGIVVALETALTPELVSEGLARELVNRIQTLRKQADFDVAQRIGIRVSGAEDVRRAFETHAEYITSETLAVQWDWSAAPLDGVEEDDLNGFKTRIQVTPV